MYPGMFLKDFCIHPTEMLVFLSYNNADKPLQVVLHIHCYVIHVLTIGVAILLSYKKQGLLILLEHMS